MSVAPDLTPAPRVALHRATRGRRARSTALGVAAVFTASAGIAVVAAHLTTAGSPGEAPAPVIVPLRANVAELTAMLKAAGFATVASHPLQGPETLVVGSK